MKTEQDYKKEALKQVEQIGKKNDETLREWQKGGNITGLDMLLNEFANLSLERKRIKKTLSSWRRYFLSDKELKRLEIRSLACLERMHELQTEVQVQIELEEGSLFGEL